MQLDTCCTYRKMSAKRMLECAAVCPSAGQVSTRIQVRAVLPWRDLFASATGLGLSKTAASTPGALNP
jgi:hypothetical protein